MKYESLLTHRNIIILYIIVAFLLYGNVLNGPFLWDDISLIVNNETIRSFGNFYDIFTTGANGGDSPLYRPLASVVRTFIYSIFELNPIAYHTVNVFFHIANSFLVCSIFTRLNFTKLASFFVGLIFLTHPVQTEVVAYAAGLPDLLAAFFILLGIQYGITDKSILNKTFYITIFLILGLLSKEYAVVLPPLLLLTYIYRYPIPSLKKYIPFFILLFGIATVYTVIRTNIFSNNAVPELYLGDNIYIHSIYIRTITFLKSLWHYAVLIFFPLHLYMEKESTHILTIFNAYSIFGLSVIIWGIKKSIQTYSTNKNYTFGFMWACIAIFPVSSILIMVNAKYFEHWLYIPIIGILVIIPHLFDQFKLYTKQLIAFFIIIVLLFSIRTVIRNHDWSDPLRFYQHEVRYNQTSARLYNQLGTILLEENQIHSAIKALKYAIDADGESKLLPHQRFNIAQAYERLGDFENAIYYQFEAALIDPNASQTYLALARIYQNKNDFETAKIFLSLLEKSTKGEEISKQTIEELQKKLLPLNPQE